MAGGAKIGAMNVSLGLNSAQFTSGLQKAGKSLNKFGVQLTLGLETIAYGIGRVIGAVPQAIKGAIDHADALSKSAQKAGVTTEALSRLAYAADFSDVSLEGLTGGLQKLSKAMADAVISKSSTSALAFKALGIQVTDANGKLRQSDVVFREIADKFARLENGATKTSLAMMIFGKSGAALIPLLNGGSAELQRMADEADRLGITLSTKTGKDAERFNDTLTLVGKVLEGVTNKVMSAALPALQSFAQTLASPEFARAAQTLATNIINGLAKIIDAIVSVINYFDELERRGKQAAAIGELRKTLSGERPKGASGRRVHGASSVYEGMLGSDGKIRLLPTPDESGGGGDDDTPIIPGIGATKKALIELTDTGDQFTDSARRMTQAVGDGLGGAFSRLADAVLSGNDALSATVDVLFDLGKQLVTGGIQNFFSGLFGGAFAPGVGGVGLGGIGRGVYGGNGGFFPGFPGLAGGTDNWRGGMTWVGENGPELLNLPRGSQVIPTDQLRGGDSRVRIDLGPGLVAQILKQADANAVQIVQTQAPLSVARFQNDRKGG